MHTHLVFLVLASFIFANCKGVATRNDGSDLASEDNALKTAHKKVCGGVASVYATIKNADGRTVNAMGTAFAIDKRGYFMTNSHVVHGAKTATIVLDPACTKSEKLPAIVVVENVDSDVALLKVEANAPLFTVLETGSQADVDVTDKIFVIGNPHGYSNTVTEGIIANKREMLPIGESKLGPIFQLGASINFGNSGGPVFTMEGQVVGLVTAKHADAQAMGFALYMGKARSMLAAALRFPDFDVLNNKTLI